MATTPPPFRLRVPPTPLHGAKYTHPREGPLPSRKSRRIAQDGKTTPRVRTPSPQPSPSRQAALRQSPRLHAKLEAKSTIGAGSLLTPVKTPVKKSQPIPTPSTSRILFPGSATPAKSSSSLLQVRTGTVTSDSIQIFEDSNARIPKADPSDDNPFSGRAQPRKKRKTASVAEEEQPKKNGIWVVFRGKKVFKEFRDEERDVIQPRRLFEEDVHQEEEDTDIASSPPPFPDDEVEDVEESPEKAMIGKVTRSRDFDAEEETSNEKPEVNELRQKRVARFVDVEVTEAKVARPSTPEPAGSHASPMTPPPTIQKKRPHPSSEAKRPARNAGLVTPHRTPKRRKIDEQASLRRAGRRTQV